LTVAAPPRARPLSDQIFAGCRCAGCEADLRPWTLVHLLTWAGELTLEDESPWEVEPFQKLLMADFVDKVTEQWAIIPEGNAKTTLAAALALYHAEHTPAPWVPIGAASRDQAQILFDQACGFVERSDHLFKTFKMHPGYRKLVIRDAERPGGRGVGIKVYPYDPNTGDGVIPTLALVDELHRHPDARLYRLWRGKLRKRGGQIVAISTAGEPGAEFEEIRENIRAKATERYRDGCYLRASGPGFVYHEWQVPSVEAAKDLAVVKDANPLAAITLAELEEKRNSPTLDYGNDWLRLTCNIPTRSEFAAIPEADWDDCFSEEEIPEKAPVGLGADFAWLLDTTAIVPLWMPDRSRRFFGDPEILEPPRDGTMLSVQEVKNAFERMFERYTVDLVVLDSTKAEDVAQWLSDEHGLTVIDRSQANEFAEEDYARWMGALGNRWFRHTGHPVFRRHVLNAIARRLPKDRYRFDRPSTSRAVSKQDRRVIDALQAAAMINGEMGGPIEAGWEPMAAAR
jgi:phage terminase large subunit-like protein